MMQLSLQLVLQCEKQTGLFDLTYLKLVLHDAIILQLVLQREKQTGFFDLAHLKLVLHHAIILATCLTT